MLLDLEGDRLYLTDQWDQEMRVLADRHYSRRPFRVGNPKFSPPGFKLILRNGQGTVLFIWSHERYRLDGQRGYNCSIFRNESPRLSSEIILEAERIAFEAWGPDRLFTYVDPRKIKSTNPGYCFLRAGWKREGLSRSGLILLAKDLYRINVIIL